jgi:transcription termination factor Rho
MSGGLDSQAMQGPRQIFGAARKIEDGGSLTIVGTALVDTGSRMDQVIFEEFKGTGNSEIFLSRELAERRIYPAIDIPKSGTRKEEKLYPPDVVPRMHLLRRHLAGLPPQESMPKLLELLMKWKTNDEIFALLKG